MKKYPLLILFGFIASLSSLNAQEAEHNLEPCGFISSLEKLKTIDNNIYPSDQVFEEWMERKIRDLEEDRSRMPPILTIPIVVHVIHNGDAIGQDENIPDAQVFSQMKVLNDDFRRKEGTSGFNSHPDGADVEIEFCLASTDINGNGFNGINRVDMGVEEWDNTGDIDDNLKPATIWDPNKYYNVWVCRLSAGLSLAGYAQFPGLSGLPGMPPGSEIASSDGVVINHLYLGSNDDDDGTFNTAELSKGRTLTHETGHWLGLRHVWGDGDCGADDFCNDTPASDNPNYGCPEGIASCGSFDMIENYMDYTTDNCQEIFTNDQKARMLTVMANSPRRKELLSSTACTGAPFALASATEISGCAVLTVRFNDLSSQSPTSWNWQFPGGIPSSSTLQNPVVSYSQLGSFDVMLSATNEYGTGEKTFPGYINVLANHPDDIFMDNFEDADISDWTIINPTGTGKWENIYVDDQTNKTGDFVIGFKNYNNDDYGARDGIVSPAINLYGRSEAELSFDYSYKKAVQSETDSLIIYLSTDGGETFPHTLFADAENGSNNLAIGGLFNGDFIPSSEGDWCGIISDCITLDLSPYIGEQDIRIKFENYSKSGSNFFMDNVRVSSICIPNNINPIAEFNADRLGCESHTVQFSDKTIGVPGTWSWSFPGGDPNSSTQPNPIVEYSQPGEYEASLTVTNGSGTDTNTKMSYIVISSEEPTAGFDLMQSFNAVEFTNQSTGGVEYLWDFDDGNFSTEANPSYNYQAMEQSYTVTLTATNGCGSSTTSQLVQTTSTRDPFGENTTFSIYPNPNNGQFTIEIKGKPHATANIAAYDILGRLVHQSEYQLDNHNWTKDINLANKAAGTYIVKIDIEGQSSYRKVVIK